MADSLRFTVPEQAVRVELTPPGASRAHDRRKARGQARSASIAAKLSAA
jgi:guanylate kinase